MKAHTHRFLRQGAAVAAALAALAATTGGCAASEQNDPGADGSGGANASGAGGAGDAVSVGSGSSGSGGDETCASHTEVARNVELNMFISFDKSGSMDSDDKWNDSTGALRSFFQDPGTDQLRVALRFFGDDLPGGAGCSQYLCNLSACAVPDVAVDYLLAAPGDPHEQALLNAISARQPGGGGGTPIHPALHGATSWAKSYKDAHPSDEVVVVLLTDGAPQGCIESVPLIASLASDALQSHGIRSYAIGLAGSHEGTMNEIAMAGGTDQAIFINNGNVSSELLAALQQIQTEASLPCQFALPVADNLDLAKVNVEFTPGGGGADSIGQVSDPSQCASVASGWYYDDPVSPSSIVLCPDTCAGVQGDPGGQIDIVVGCDTKVAQPK